MNKRTTFNLPVNYINQLKALAEAMQLSQSEVIEFGTGVLTEPDFDFVFSVKSKHEALKKHSIVLKESVIDKIDLVKRKYKSDRTTILINLIRGASILFQVVTEKENQQKAILLKDAEAIENQLGDLYQKTKEMMPDLLENEEPLDSIMMAIGYLNETIGNLQPTTIPKLEG